MLHDVCFVDALRGWAVGENGTILATRSGGVAHIPTASPTPTPRPTQVHHVVSGEAVRRHTKTVKGPVKGTKYASSSSGRPTFINIGKNYPNRSRFTVVIWGKYRSAFPSRPEVLYRGKTVLATGKIRMYKGSAQMFIRSPSKLRIVP